MKLALGYTMTQDTTRHWGKPAKSTDLVDLESVLRFTLGVFVDPFASLRLESQFIDTRDALFTRYLNPIKPTEGFGVVRVFIKQPKQELASKLGGAFKQVIDRDVLTPDGRQTITDNYGGILFSTDFHTPLFGEQVTYLGRFSVFQALFFSKRTSSPVRKETTGSNRTSIGRILFRRTSPSCLWSTWMCSLPTTGKSHREPG